jgi:hypothetical protein
MTFRSAVSCVLLLVAACSSDAGDPGTVATGPIEPTTRDSGGVAVHEHPGDAIDRAPRFSLDTLPLATLGVGSEEDLSRVFHVRLFPDGRIVFYDDATGALRLFSAEGTQLVSLGRKGEGPGEFQYVSALVLAGGDTVAIHDPGLSRVTLINLASGDARMFSVPPMGMFVSYALIGRAPSGWFFAPTGYAVNGPPEFATNGVRPTVAIAQLAESAGAAGTWDTVGTTLGLELIRHRMEMGGQAREMSSARHFAPQGMIAGWSDGSILVSDNERWELRVLGDRGALRSVIRVARSRRATGPATLDSLMAVLRQSVSGAVQATPEMVEALLAAERAKPMVDSLPPFAAVYPTPGDVMWLAEYLAPGDPEAYFTAIDRQGRIVGRLALPAASRAMAFGTDRVLLRLADADGVVRFVVQRIQ